MRRSSGPRWPFPGWMTAVAAVFAFFFATAWLAVRLDYLPEYSGPALLLTLGVGLAASVLPSGRRNGGCGLGVALSFAALFGFGYATSGLPKESDQRTPPRLATPVAQWLRGVPPTLDGRVPLPGQALEGRVLAQGDRILISAGDSLARARHVLQPGVGTRRHFRREGYLIELPEGSGRVETIRLSRE